MDDLKYGHVVTALLSAIWAIQPEKLAAIMELVRFRAGGGTLTAEEVRERIGAVVKAQSRAAGSVAVLPIYGTIIPRGNMLTESSGAVSVDKLTSQLRQAVSDPGVSAIVLDIDSPGGAVDGIPELASEILAARSAKPVLAVANTLAASAAYWLGTQAQELYASPSSEVGSIGVFTSHSDASVFWEQAGIKTSLISAGKYKTEGSPFAPLGEEARVALQERVDSYYDMFTRAVARGRGVSVDEVRGGYGEGRVVGAKQAMALGMVDGRATLDQVVGMAALLGRQPARQSSAADMERRRVALG